MKRFAVPVFLIIAIIGISMTVYLVSCGGGGGGSDVEQAPPPPGGSGTIDGITVFWFPYDTNIAMGSGNAVRETSDHGFVVAGSQSLILGSSFAPLDVFLMKTDAQGTAEWKKRYSWPGGAEAKDVRQTSDGGYIVTGQTYTQTFYHRVYILKTDANGNAEAGWPKIFGGAADSAGYAVLEVPDGYLVAGFTSAVEQDGQEHAVAHVMLVNTAGMVEWEKTYSHFCAGGNEIARALAPTADGKFVIAGYTGCYGWKGILLKIDGQGNELWRNIFAPSATTMERVHSVATATDGFVLAGSRATVTGTPPVDEPADALVIRTDMDGNELWRRTYGGSDCDEAFSVAVDQDNHYLVFGYTQSYGGTVNPSYQWQYQDLFLIKLDSNGNTLWQKVKGNRPMSSDFGVSGCIVSDGGFSMAGSSGGNVLLAKFDKNGDTVDLGATDLSITVPATMGIITFGNAIDLASAGATGIMRPRDVGATAVDLLIATLNGDPASDFCNVGGTYAFSPVPAAPLSSGTFTLTFSGCVSGPAGDAATLNGGATIAVESVLGLVTTGTYTIQTTLNPVNITAVEMGGTLSSSFTGGMRFRRVATASSSSERSDSIDASTTLTFSETDGSTTRTRVVGPFIIRNVVTASGYYIGSVAGDTATVDPGIGPLVVTFPSTTAPVHGPGLGAAPVSGSFLVTAPSDSSRLTATITNGVAEIAVDTDGNGTVDGTVSATWDFLD